MKRWYQRQSWYVEKPMPWAMVLLWPVLWFVGTVDELVRWFRKGEHSAAPTVRVWDKDFNYIGTVDNEPWRIITEEKPDGYYVSVDTDTETWELLLEPDLSDWHELVRKWEAAEVENGEWQYTGMVYGNKLYTTRTVYPPIVDRDYE